MKAISFLKNVFSVVAVRGDSMLPTLQSGDYVLTSTLLRSKPKAMVVITHPDYGLVVKRVKALKEGQVLLSGDNAQSVSPDAMGWLDQSLIKGVVFKIVRQ